FLWLDFLQSNIQQKIFSPNMRIQIWSGELLPERDRSRGHQPKRWSEPQRAVLKTGCRGEPPAILSPCFLIKKAGPPPGRRGNGALRPEAASEAPPVGCVPPGVAPGPTSQVCTCAPSRRD